MLKKHYKKIKVPTYTPVWVWLIRLAAFILLLIYIVQKINYICYAY